MTDGPQAPSPDATPAPGAAALSGMQALSAAPISITVFGPDHLLRFVNAEMLRQLDLPADTDLSGRSLTEVVRLCAFRGFFGPGDPEELTQDALLLDRARPQRRTVRARDGRWFDLVSEPLADGGFASYATDVSAHRRGVLEAEARAATLDMAVRRPRRAPCSASLPKLSSTVSRAMRCMPMPARWPMAFSASRW